MSHDKVIRRACARESWNPRCCHRDQYCNCGRQSLGVILSVLQEDEDILNKLFSAHSFVDMRLEHVRQRRRFSFQFLVFKMAHDAGHSVSHQCLVLSAAQSRHRCCPPISPRNRSDHAPSEEPDSMAIGVRYKSVKANPTPH
jgi:hypothetical protein